ncbi:stage V sporulation protein AD [Sulfoacidibacillus thermotolerans]|uniref:Stage V sporulation protein AD n=1 Tax=Sulfoacidibacillus thermotolerans TaxID=1765684 RepID=A0A2U3D6Q6_SULT2|nr:stage V sporulation protein AD [Sulfoacidibacillus thermotolerans]PWI56969.1 stage V sporulation protein AD [Sulfoacidibacillus thermotolerans]
MLIGQQTWEFTSRPRVLGTGTAVGEKEGAGPLGTEFDLVFTDPYLGQESWEKAERKLLEQAQEMAVQKAGLSMESVDVSISGDLLPHIISANFAARTNGKPLLGIYSACATSMEAVALSALLVDARAAKYALASTSSHNSTAERVFRYPTEYGGQKPPTAHCTVTGAGAAVIGHGINGPIVRYATIGKVLDLGVKSPWEMGAAMAPAATDTIVAHFRDTGLTVNDYDFIATGDLARVGHPIARELLKHQGIELDERFSDCGILMYHEDQPEVFSGGSGPACCACVTFGHLLRRIQRGEWKRILVVATGALLSTVSAQQSETIPCIAHAVTFEAENLS